MAEAGITLLVVGGNASQRQEKIRKIVGQFFSQIPAFNPDLNLLTGKIGISQVRNFKLELSRKPYQEQIQLGLIEIDEITIEAQNALLKLIEEPAKSTQIIISVDCLEKLLPTIVSRCSQIFVSDWQEEQNLVDIVQDGEVIVRGNLKQKFALAEIIARNQPEQWIRQQIFFWRRVFLEQLGIEKQNLPPVGKVLAKDTQILITFRLLKKLLQNQLLLKLNINPRLLLENLFISI